MGARQKTVRAFHCCLGRFHIGKCRNHNIRDFCELTGRFDEFSANIREIFRTRPAHRNALITFGHQFFCSHTSDQSKTKNSDLLRHVFLRFRVRCPIQLRESAISTKAHRAQAARVDSPAHQF